MFQNIASIIAQHKALAIAGTIVVGTVGYAGVSSYNQANYYNNLAKELTSEEAKDSTAPFAVSDADKDVSTFKYSVNITVGPNGFEPAVITAKPSTKLIFTGTDTSKHFIAVSPGSKAPKYFDPQIYVTSTTIFQTKVDEAGVYSFYDREHPQSTLAVNVAP
jgi:plastocyanin